MSRLLVRPRPPSEDGCVLNVTPESAGWSHVGFRLHQLRPDQIVHSRDSARETCVVVLTGLVDIMVDGRRFQAVGGRGSVFDPVAPGAVYVPAGARFEVAAKSAAEVALCSAPGRPGREARLIAGGHMPSEVRGQGTNTRHVRNILPETEPADSLLVVEVITPGGH